MSPLLMIGFMAYALVFFFCAGGSVIAGVLARRWNRQMLVARDAAQFRGLENKFNQAFTVCGGLATLAIVLLAFVPTILRDLKVLS